MDRKHLLKKKYVELGRIASNPQNPREDFQDQTLGESIEELTMIDPIDVRPISDEDQVAEGIHFLVCDGDRRLDVQKEIHPADHMLTVGKDVLIHDLMPDEAFDFNITKNMQRKNYNLREECNIVQHYKEQGLKQTEIAKKCNRSRTWVQDRIHLLEASHEILIKVLSGELNLNYYRIKETASRSTSEVVDQLDERLPLDAPKETITIEGPAEEGFQFKLSVKNKTKFLCLKSDYGPFQELIIDFNPKTDIVTVHNEKEHQKALTILTSFAGYLGLDKDIRDVLKTYQHAEIFKEFPETNGKARIDVVWKDLEDKNEFELLLKRYKNSKVQVPVDDRTTVLTKQQFEAIRKSMIDFFKKAQSYQPIDKLVHVRWRDYDDHLNTIKWILQNKDDFPLDDCQLERYTDLTAEQISTILENGQAQKEDVKRESIQKDSSVEDLVWKDLTPEEHSALPEYLSSLVLRKEHLKAEDKIRLFFKDWTEQNQVANYFSPAQDFFKQLEKLPFPLDEDLIQLVNNNTLNMIEFNWKFFKKYYPRLQQEYIEAKKLWSEFSKTFTVSLFTRFHSKIGYIKIQIDNFKSNLQWVRENTIISPDGQVLVFSYCTKCFKQKRLRLDQNICGNCELSNSQQQKKAAAASNSGGAN